MPEADDTTRPRRELVSEIRLCFPEKERVSDDQYRYLAEAIDDLICARITEALGKSPGGHVVPTP